MANHPNRQPNKTASFLAENNITVESVLYSASDRTISVERGLCGLEDVTAADFVRGVAERQRTIGRSLEVKIV